MRNSFIVLLSLLTWSTMQLPVFSNGVRVVAATPNNVDTCEASPIRLSAHMDAPACAGQPVYSPWGWNRGQFFDLDAIPQANTCSITEITHLGARFGPRASGRAQYEAAHETRSWLTQFVPETALERVPDIAVDYSMGDFIAGSIGYDWPMCWRSAKRGNERGPNPWAESALTVSLGPPVVSSIVSSIAPPAAPPQPSPAPIMASFLPASGNVGAHIGALTPAYSAMTPLPMNGLAMYYNPGIMRQVVEYRENRGEIEACADCVGFAALLRAGDLNRKIWIQWSDGTVEGPFLVADVAAHHHVDMLIQRGWAVDVDNQTAVRRGMFQPVAVTVHATPPRSGGGTPTD